MLIFLQYKKIYLTLIFLSLASCGGGSGSSAQSSNNNSNNDSGNNDSGNNNSGTVLVTYNTSNVMCSYSDSGVNTHESVNAAYDYTWSCSSSNRNLSANGIPNHEIGTFPNANNPNSLGVINISRALTS